MVIRSAVKSTVAILLALPDRTFGCAMGCPVEQREPVVYPCGTVVPARAHAVTCSFRQRHSKLELCMIWDLKVELYMLQTQLY